MLVFDIETDGLLKELTKVHCINVKDRATGERFKFNRGVYDDTGEKCERSGSIEDGLLLLAGSDRISGHNIIGFDIPAIRKVYPQWKPRGRAFDTLIASRVIYTNLTDRDFRALRGGRLAPEFQKRGLIGSHSLEAWGHRLGEHKGEFTVAAGQDKWSLFVADMDTYAQQDVVVSDRLTDLIESKNYSAECLELEHRVAEIIFRQHEHGFVFDVKHAEALTGQLTRRHAELEDTLRTTFKPWKKSLGMFTPKRSDKKRGYAAGVPVEKFKEQVFNPASRDHIADRLTQLRGWKPAEFTPEGKPKVDETVLGALPYPEAKLLSEYLMVEKRLGQVAVGKEAWLRHATNEGIFGVVPPLESAKTFRIHGSVNSNGAVTGRMTHSRPNIAQAPKADKEVPYGKDCRDCFTVADAVHYALVGCDAEGLELRCLAHFMAKWDGGAYAETVINGKKEDKSDVHSVNQRAAGLNLRDSAKTFIYALIYGAGEFKLGTIVYEDFTDLQKGQFLEKYTSKRDRERALTNLGKARRARIMENLPALAKLVSAVKNAVGARGQLIGIDGRLLHVRSEHAALNTLLQSAGAVVMKKALVLFEDDYAARIRVSKVSSNGDATVIEYCANVHDEVQLEVLKEIAEDAGKKFAECITLAGEHFKFRCPLSGSYSVGKTWAQTH